jgi:UPF0755 protein
MRKSALFIVCFLLIVGLAALNQVRADVLIKDFEISKGTSFNEIAKKLKSEGIIRSKLIFQIYSFIAGKAFKFKPGRYALASNISISELTDILVNGPQEIPAVIFPGMTVSEIDEKLSALKIINSGELINSNRSLEGYLFPDTYHFYAGSDINSVIHRFLENFNSKALPFFNNNVNILDTLILASLLEKEIPDYEEKRIAAGILLKRLKIGMPLQVDATLVYAKCAGFLNCPRLTEADYKIDSAYNTYLYFGLPKGPISNPGLESIKAVLNYKKTEYLYYLSDPETKKTIFSKTLDEHNKNRAKYLLINR